MPDLRCTSKKYGETDGDGHIIVKCSSKFCDAGPGVVVLHYFDNTSGKLVKTCRYKEIGASNAAHDYAASVRHP
jgi:hypothetical protein